MIEEKVGRRLGLGRSRHADNGHFERERSHTTRGFDIPLGSTTERALPMVFGYEALADHCRILAYTFSIDLIPSLPPRYRRVSASWSAQILPFPKGWSFSLSFIGCRKVGGCNRIVSRKWEACSCFFFLLSLNLYFPLPDHPSTMLDMLFLPLLQLLLLALWGKGDHKPLFESLHLHCARSKIRAGFYASLASCAPRRFVAEERLVDYLFIFLRLRCLC